MDQSFRFGTVGSPKSTPKKPGGSVGAIQQLRTLGFGAFELGWVQSVRVSEETCSLIAQSAQENDVLLSVHAPYFINLNATDDEWPKSRQRLMDAAYYGNLAGASDVIFHPGSYFGQPVAEVLERSIARLAGCVTELRSKGNPIIVRPETMGKSAMLGSLEDTLAMSQAIDGVVPCLDFAHLYARSGDGLCNTIEKWTEVFNGYAKFLGRDSLKRLHIHLSGIEYGPKGERNHVPVLECDLDLMSLFKTLKSYECAGRILCESPAMEEDALVMQNYWQRVVDET